MSKLNSMFSSSLTSIYLETKCCNIRFFNGAQFAHKRASDSLCRTAANHLYLHSGKYVTRVWGDRKILTLDIMIWAQQQSLHKFYVAAFLHWKWACFCSMYAIIWPLKVFTIVVGSPLKLKLYCQVLKNLSDHIILGFGYCLQRKCLTC